MDRLGAPWRVWGGGGHTADEMLQVQSINVALIAMKRAKLAQKAARVEETIRHGQLQ